jgi:DNA-binding CsgD family transcriptional regulator
VRIERADALELLVHAWTALGDQVQAEAVLDEFRSIAKTAPTKPMQGSVHFAEGMVAATARDYDTAQRCFEDAVELWSQIGAPVEAAQARLGLAGILIALGRSETAEQELSAALESLQTIGAAGVAAHAATLLEQLRKSRRGGSNLARLTGRELEILGLVAQGLSNKEIAAQLVLSEHTVHRHIANILTKLNLSSRAAAAAYAARHNLL